MNKFPQKLKEVRTARKVTQEELGNYLGFRDSTISQYESGIREPDYDTLVKIAQFFETTTDYLLGRTTQSYQQSPSKHSIARDPSPTTIAAHRTDNIFDREDVPAEAKKSVEDYIEFVKKKYGIKE